MILNMESIENIISNKSIQDKIIKNDISNWKSKLKC
jgi:16S rRNA C1402 N4-methylase RsmH